MLRVDAWIEPVFHALMEHPNYSLDLERLHQIGEIGSYHLIQTKDTIRKNRARLAFGMPKLRGFTDCNTPGSYGRLSREVQYIEYAILELMEYQTDEPVRAKLREMVNVTT
ncbi:hypothetical protein B0H11DRAFT_1907503 [Mycena galericulata]|nr:hypothetical protein B0H11DRAFT_1907503 [Mycena galericulata]